MRDIPVRWLIGGIVCVGLAVVIILSVCLTGNCGGTTSEPGCNLECYDTGAAWGYEIENGPDCWGSCYDTCGTGTQQSPINILESTLESIDYPPIEFIGYDEATDMLLYNDGHSAKLRLASNTYNISGLGLEGDYVADSFHFHWGSTDTVGSEHQIDGVSAPLEMHIVNYSANYTNLDEALGNEGGVAVLGFAFHIGYGENSYFSDVVDHLRDIQYKGSEFPLTNQRLGDYLPAWYNGKYYRYQGSLTTPGCTEGLVWTIFADTIPISESQLEIFRSTLYTEEEQSSYKHIVSHNFRPPQALNGRKVLVGSMMGE